MFVTAIIAAGGRGLRLGGDRPKQLLTVGGRPMLERSVSAFLAHDAVSEVIVALPAEMVDERLPYLSSAAKPIRVVPGGARRQDSVANAVRAASDASEVVVIHDAARPFASSDLISRTIAAAAEAGAAVAALGARDTVKQTDPSRRGAAIVSGTLPRETIFLAQTPQAFRKDVLVAALALGASDSVEATDEASLAERAGHAVRLVEGEATNIKITTAEDLVIAEALVRRAPARTGRAGTGYDLHRLVEGRPLILGGVHVPSDRGALGHSDADVVCHAITDAVLGAACLGDIGLHFPDNDARWKDSSSVDLLTRAVALVRAQGLEVGNVDVTVILEAPKIRPYIAAMRASVAGAIGIDVDRVSIKGKTNEGVDAIGRGEALAAHAVALVRNSST